MKRKTFTQVLKSILIMLFVLGIGEVGWGQTIVNFPMDPDWTNTPDITIPGNESALLNTNAGTPVYDYNDGATVTGWANGNGTKSWYTTSIITTDYVNIMFSTNINSSTDGPKDFKVQYSLNNSTWVDVRTITATAVLTNTGNIGLPDICSNQPQLYIRLLMSSNLAVGGGNVTSSGTNSVSAFTLLGNPPATPSSQASSIKFVAITPTTIKVSCTAGNGDSRIIVMNTANTFTLPGNNYNPTANSTYSSGEKVVYNGTGNVVTVTVPNASNVYWFRVFDYDYNDGMTRYITPAASSNPRQCKLETITLPTVTNVSLTSAILGGTISTPLSGTVSSKGIFWSTTSLVDDNSTKVVLNTTNTGGTFTVTVTGLPRSSIIYFKPYVTNAVGTIMTDVTSFDNTPIFTGTGNWTDAARWNNSNVPGSTGTASDASALDSPIINGTCTLTADNTCNNLTVNSGKVLNINPLKGLTVNGTLTNNGGTSGLVLASDATGTGSLMHNSANVNATVERYISGSTNLYSKKYHLVSVPLNSTTYLSNVWLDSYLFTYIEGTNDWYIWDSPTDNVLQTKQGAMVFYPFGGGSKTYSITGQLNNGTYSPTVAYSGAGFGYNLVPNPYPSTIDWNAASGWTKTNITGTIWGFNSTLGNYGSWTGSAATNGMSRYIPVGQGFFVMANASSPVLTMNNSVRLINTTAFLKSGEIVPNVLNLTASGNDGQDEIAVQFADDATSGYDSKYDAAKFYGDKTVPQLSSYTADDASLLSISGLPAGQTSTIVPLHLDMDYKGDLTFTAKGIESFNETSIQLEDKQLAQMIDLNINPVYTFNHTPTDALDRFVLHFSSIQTGIVKPGVASLSKVTTSGHEIYLQYPSASSSNLMATVYDLQGRVINQFKLSGKGNDHISIPTSGAYLVKLNLPSVVETHKIVVL